MTPAEKAAAVAEGMHNPWDDHLGLVYEEMGGDQVVAHVDIEERHLQPYGITHGGVWASIVESMASGGAAMAAAPDMVVGVSNTTDFLRAHRGGRVDAVARPIHQGRSQQLWEVRITRADDGKLIARGQVRLQVVPEGVR